MRFARDPVTQFLVIGLLTLGVILVGVDYLAGRAASAEATSEVTRIHRLLGSNVVRPAMSPRLVAGDLGAADALDRRLKGHFGIEGVTRISIRRADGRILYSSEGSHFIGKRFPLYAAQRDVLRHGDTRVKRADLGLPENRLDDPSPQVQVDTRMRAQDGRPLIFEAYYSLNEIEERQNEIYGTFRWIVLAPLGMLILLSTLILIALTRQLRRGAAERERLLRSAIDASDAERRRIARDLHDGVVQDLAGTAFTVGALARLPDLTQESRDTLGAAGASLRTSLKSLRSLLAEIHPPDLRAESLPAALSDLIAPAGASGIQASVSVKGAETASDSNAALVWRVAQEAVRNALRHARASTLAVTVRGGGGRLTLEVVDDGVGFDPAREPDPDSFGLRGLRSLVSDHGGTLAVRSSPGEGTTVRMEVEAQ